MAYPKVRFGGATAGDSAPERGGAAQPSFPQVERDVLDFWSGDKTFQDSVQAREAGADGGNEFVFYDGPPFANGLPHYGHLLTGYVKDAVPRYQTMRGRRVERRFGWDCHGLPAEVREQLDTALRVPIYGAAESLNLATAAAVCLYASARASRHGR